MSKCNGFITFFQAAKTLYDLRDKDGFGENEKGEWMELWGGHYSPFVLAKLWAAILCHVRRLQEAAGNKGKEPTVEQWATAKAPYRRYVEYFLTELFFSHQCTADQLGVAVVKGYGACLACGRCWV